MSEPEWYDAEQMNRIMVALVAGRLAEMHGSERDSFEDIRKALLLEEPEVVIAAVSSLAAVLALKVAEAESVDVSDLLMRLAGTERVGPKSLPADEFDSLLYAVTLAELGQQLQSAARGVTGEESGFARRQLRLATHLATLARDCADGFDSGGRHH